MKAYEAHNGYTTVFCGAKDLAEKYVEGLDGWQIRSIEIPDPTPIADWARFANACLDEESFMQEIKIRAVPNEWTVLVAIIQTGTSQERLLSAIQKLGITFTDQERAFLNQTFEDCGFTIRIP